jgi:hypothetical protein
MMEIEEKVELQWQLGRQNKDFIMKFFYTPIAKFLAANEHNYKNKLAKLKIADIRKVPTKDDMLRMVFELYADEEIVMAYLANYSERDRIIMGKAVWDGGLGRDALQELFKKPVLTRSGSGYYAKIEAIPELRSSWGEYLTIDEPNGFYGDVELILERSDVRLSFPMTLRKLLAIYFTKPAGYLFEPVPEPDSSLRVLLTEDNIFKELPRILAYHGQGNIKYSQKGNPNQASAKKMSKALKLFEFGLDSEFPIRSLLLAGLISENFKMKSITDAPEKIIRKFFSTDFDSKPAAPYMLPHLKGLNYFHHDDFVEGTSQAIFSVFKKLPFGKWVTFDNLICFLNGRFLDISPLSDWNLVHKIQAEFEDEAGKWGTRIHMGNKWELVARPYLAGHVTLMAAFGLMDIAVDPTIENELTAYDHLYGLRLTELGAYVLGLSKEYTRPVTQASTSLTFDERSLTIRIEGDVALGDTLLANYASRVTENRYQFSAGKFLKDCKTTNDIKTKVELFRQTVGQKLPLFWEEYFGELVENSKSVTPKSRVRVFTIPPENKALQRTIAQDEILRMIVIKGEQYHIIISEHNLATFGNRMKELGYVLG